ncbi:MAG TPA: ABC transporter substrate-binding protein [Stellaceae bacterium]|nr:ABC transporter substrate-binding protein [Stellaceae bacterium]
MTGQRKDFSRRRLLGVAGALGLATLIPIRARAQAAPLRLGCLNPLTGAGGADGPRMLKAMQAVAAEVNAAGGVLGRQIELISEDDETNPDSGVRGARKLIDIDKVPAIMGTWASAVTTAVAPLLWESKTFLTTVSGADSITKLPHQGYLVRTQPNNHLQAQKHAEFIAALGKKKVFVVGIQAPFAVPTRDRLAEVLKEHGSAMVGSIIYDKDKATYRTEVDQALKESPDLIYLNGYVPDVTVVLKDLYRAGYTGAKFTQSYALTQKSLESIPAEVTEGTYIVQPSPSIDSPAYALAAKRNGVENPDTYVCQSTDHISLVLLSIAKAKEATGTAIRDTVRKISQGSGTKVYSALEGLKLVAEGKEINYEGASGPCDFDEIGDILECKFRFDQVQNRTFKLVKIG